MSSLACVVQNIADTILIMIIKMIMLHLTTRACKFQRYPTLAIFPKPLDLAAPASEKGRSLFQLAISMLISPEFPRETALNPWNGRV